MSKDGLLDRLAHEVKAARLPAGPGEESPVPEDDLADLPELAQRYLRFMGVVGRPRTWSFRARVTGRFRLRPRLGWMPAEAWQYNSGIECARVFVMRLRLARVIPMVGSDTYVRGRGRMLGKLLDRVVVADGSGEEFDLGELTTYLNDCVLLAPSMLLRPAVAWEAVDDHSFDVSMSDAGRTVRGRVFVDGRGAPYDFSTTDRYADLPGGLTRAEWRTPVSDWRRVDGRHVPTRFEIAWQLPQGPLPYFSGALTHLAYNLTPGSDPSSEGSRIRSPRQDSNRRPTD
jgi:hypothetical protein